MQTVTTNGIYTHEAAAAAAENDLELFYRLATATYMCCPGSRKRRRRQRLFTWIRAKRQQKNGRARRAKKKRRDMMSTSISSLVSMSCKETSSQRSGALSRGQVNNLRMSSANEFAKRDFQEQWNRSLASLTVLEMTSMLDNLKIVILN